MANNELKPKSLGQQVADAQAEMATWSPEKRASVQLQGSSNRAAPAQAEPSDALPEWPKSWQERLKAAMHPGMYDSMGGEDACRILAEPHMQAEITELRAYAKQAIEARGALSDAEDAARWRYVRDTETLETAVWEALEGTDCAPDGVLDKVAYARGMDRAVDAAIQAQAGDALEGGKP